MNKILKSILKEIEIQPFELTDDKLENTNQYKFIYNKIVENLGEPTFKRVLAIRLITEQLFREDNYGSVDFNRHKEKLKKMLMDLSETEMSDLISHYYGVSDPRRFQMIESVEYLTSHNERINVSFIINVLANSIVDEINYEILLVKLKLQNIIYLKEWHSFYGVNKDDYTENEYNSNIERINDIITGVLK
ncbi:hypothetical protein [Lutibacter flavus]|uniref:Uncharacterized protein n=1 Tax=Lutibacter flavus TaxID=691689 RepID=A0A238VFA5_9FLAO|nr:hypothetical protein [Lutibacter flavus]SNR33072.1 hypothetical protein SAMN04488111_0406 [Lutibacter flavus]